MQAIQQAIFERDFEYICNHFFTKNNELKDNVKSETELWDYKSSLPPAGHSHRPSWARIAKHVLAFHNNKGGILIFGVKDNYEICKTNAEIDSKKFNDQIRKFLPDTIYVDFISYARDENNKYIGIAIIPPRSYRIECFIANAPSDKGKILFQRGWSAIRKEDQSNILSANDFVEFRKKDTLRSNNQLFCVDEKFFRILSPEYKDFVYRSKYCDDILKGLSDKRTSIVSITGIGGIGKTALSTWAVLESYNKQTFQFIVSVTAKDRELSHHGINAIFPTITTFESVLASIFDVLGLQEYKSFDIDEQEKAALQILSDSGGLLYIDNLETIEDNRIINFLDNLPYGVKAITTSRRARVRFSVYPITIEKMEKDEVFDYLKKLSREKGLIYMSPITRQQAETIGYNVDQIPLALKWCARRSSSIEELLEFSRGIKDSGKASEELLEFSYRRIFDKMTSTEKSILYALACFNRGVETNVLLFICNNSENVEDAIETLSNDSLIIRYFNEKDKVHEYSLMPLTRNFILNQLKTSQANEKHIRNRIKTYYEALDIRNEIERESMKVIRAHGGNKFSTYTTLAELAIKDKKFEDAERHLQSAIHSDRNQFKAYRMLGELYRHHLHKTADAVRFFELASNNINKASTINEKIIFYREYGLLLLFTQDKDSKVKAQKTFEKALSFGYDSISINKLSELLIEKGKYDIVIKMIEKDIEKMTLEDKKFIYPRLIKCYKMKNDLLKVALLEKELQHIG